MNIKQVLKAAGDAVLPRGCVVCGGRLNLEEEFLCLGCLADMPLTRFWERGHNPMADKFNGKIQGLIEKDDGRRGAGGGDESGEGGVHRGGGRERYASAAALFFYHSDAGYRKILYQIKYQGNTGAGKYFGRMLGRRLARYRKKEQAHKGEEPINKKKGQTDGERWPWADVDMVVPVPLHWTRRWKRGYNQAEVIAGAVAEEMGVPMRNDVLERRRRTRTQTKLGIEEKARNVERAFSVRGNIRKELAGDGGIRGMKPPEMKSVRHIVLVDDVFTTGSTLASCFRAIRDVFPPSVRVSVVTLGYLER